MNLEKNHSLKQRTNTFKRKIDPMSVKMMPMWQEKNDKRYKVKSIEKYTNAP